ncbi:MAG: TatD family hydrolase [Eubacteriales bacterium]|jgi:TatD DNase family protein
MIFDTHAHYEDEAFDTDREEVIRSLPAAGVTAFVNVASTWDSLEKTKTVAETHDHAYAAYGIHPDNVSELSEERMEILKKYCLTDKCVAVGEIGLDYHHGKETRDEQILWFRRQLGLARELGLPVIIHSRDAAEDTMKIAREEKIGGIGGVVHCYSYSPEDARQYVRMGLFLGVGGVVTFKNARRLKETVAEEPLESLVLETDCPYLAPEPHRGTRNSSANLPYVVQAIAEIKGVTAEEVENVTYQNALRMYHLSV